MNYSISITVDLDEYDAAVYNYCHDSSERRAHTYSYTDIIDSITNDLHMLDGVGSVVFDHSAWMTVHLGVSCFDVARGETEVVMSEIRQVFVKHGVIL